MNIQESVPSKDSVRLFEQTSVTSINRARPLSSSQQKKVEKELLALSKLSCALKNETPLKDIVTLITDEYARFQRIFKNEGQKIIQMVVAVGRTDVLHWLHSNEQINKIALLSHSKQNALSQQNVDVLRFLQEQEVDFNEDIEIALKDKNLPIVRLMLEANIRLHSNQRKQLSQLIQEVEFRVRECLQSDNTTFIPSDVVNLINDYIFPTYSPIPIKMACMDS